MSTAPFSKAELRDLRSLADTVYEADAHRLLETLDAEFKRWREGEIFSSELLAAIHEFHQRDSRELWSVYQSLKAPEIVARGVALGLIPPTALGPLEDKLGPLIELFTPDTSST